MCYIIFIFNLNTLIDICSETISNALYKYYLMITVVNCNYMFYVYKQNKST